MPDCKAKVLKPFQGVPHWLGSGPAPRPRHRPTSGSRPRRTGRAPACCSSERGTCKTVTARFWSWLDSGRGVKTNVQGVSYSLGSGPGLVFKAHRLLYPTTLGLRVIKKKKEDLDRARNIDPRAVRARGARVARPRVVVAQQRRSCQGGVIRLAVITYHTLSASQLITTLITPVCTHRYTARVVVAQQRRSCHS